MSIYIYIYICRYLYIHGFNIRNGSDGLGYILRIWVVGLAPVSTDVACSGPKHPNDG